MKTNRDIVLREVAGSYLLIDEGVRRIDSRSMLSLNEPAAWLWRRASQSENGFDEKMLTDWLTEEYDVDKDTAAADVARMLALWKEYGLVEA